MLTLSVASLYPYGLNRIFGMASEAGFKGLELMVRPQGDSCLDSWDADYLRELEREHETKIMSLHVPFTFEKDQSSFAEILALAEKLETDHIVIHAPRADQNAYEAWLSGLMARNRPLVIGQGIIVENLHKKEGVADPIYIQPGDFKDFPGVCLDTAHALRSGLDPLAFLKELDNVRQLHLSAWDGKDDHMSILADKERFAALLALKPVKHICLELCPKAFKDITDRKEIIDTLRATVDFVDRNKA